MTAPMELKKSAALIKVQVAMKQQAVWIFSGISRLYPKLILAVMNG